MRKPYRNDQYPAANSSKGGYFSAMRLSRDYCHRRENDKAKAAVSVFGFGGANAHLVLEEPHTQLRQKPATVKAKEHWLLLVWMPIWHGG